MALSFCFDQASFFQDAHVVRDGGLRQFHALLDIGGAEAGFLMNRASALFPESEQDAAASWIGNGVEKTIEVSGNLRHWRFLIFEGPQSGD